MMYFYRVLNLNQLQQAKSWLLLHKPGVTLLAEGMVRFVTDQPILEQEYLDDEGFIRDDDYMLRLPGDGLLWKAPQIGAFGEYWAGLLYLREEFIYATANDEPRLDSLIKLVQQSAAGKNTPGLGDKINMEVMFDGTKHIKFKRGQKIDDSEGKQ